MYKRSLSGLSREIVLSVTAGLVLGAVVVALVPSGDAQARGAASAAASQHDAWLEGLDGTYQQLFDAATPNGGIPLVHVMNYYDTYNSAYKVPDSEIDAVLTFYGATTFHGLSDAMWEKYNLASFVGEPESTVNPWRTNPTVLGMELPQASIESLQKRGATFIICNNALGIFANIVAQAQGIDGEELLKEFKANILPGVTIVPGMVIAIDKAQRAGVSYHKQ
jgi:intracellular sulfur oxidation DsrE/DsrF family protein